MGKTRLENGAAHGGSGGLAHGAGSLVVLSLSLLLALGASAFDSEAWLRKRAGLMKEAERLRTAYAACAAAVDSPAEDVTVPVETFPDGSVKFVVRAKRAQYFLDTGLVWAEGVEARKFKRDGTLDLTLVATNCVIDRASKSGWADGPATLVQGESAFRGRGIYFSSPDGYVRVTQDSDLDSKDLKAGGALSR